MNMDGMQTVTSEGGEVITEPAVDANAHNDVKQPSSGEGEGQTANTDGTGKPENNTDDTPPWLKAEITKERNRRRAAEEETQRLKEQVDRLTRAIGDKPNEERGNEPKPNDRPVRPRPNDFFTPEDYDAAMDAYEDAVSEWQVAQAERRVEEKLSKRGQEQAQAQRLQEAQAAWQKQVEAITKDHPDFDEVVYSDDFHCTPAMMEAIVQDDNGAKIAYHLATNPAEAEKIAAMTPVRQIAAIGRLSDKIVSAPPVSKAPPPIKPLGNQAPALPANPAEESEAEYFARRSAEAKARNEKVY